MTYYKKVGRKYLPIQTHEIEGWGEGLYLITQTPNNKETLSCLHVHNLQHAAKFSDLYKANKEEVTKAVSDAIASLKGQFSADELATRIIVQLSNK
jgi:hypothetical protein